MFLARAAWPLIRGSVLQAATKPSIRCFGSSLPCRGLNIFNFYELPYTLDKALVRLREMQEEKPRHLRQDEIATEWLDQLDAEKKKDPLAKDILVGNDPLSEELAERYRSLFETAFRVNVWQASQIREEKPAGLIGYEANYAMVSTLSRVFPPPTREEVEAAMKFYLRLVNKRVFLEELTFSNPKLASIYKDFLELDLSDEDPDKIEAALKKWDLPSKAAFDWFLIFSTWSSIPCDDKPFLFPYVGPKFDYVAQVGETPPSWNTQLDSKKPNEPPKSNEEMQRMIDRTRTPMAVLFSLLFFIGYMWFSDRLSNNEISFQQFCGEFLRKNLVSKIHVVNNKTAVIELNDNGRQMRARESGHMQEADYYFNIGLVESFERQLKNVQDEYKIPESLRVPVIYSTEGSIAKVLVNFLPTLLFLGAIYYMTKKANLGAGGPLSFGKSQAKKFNQEKDIKIRFKDVAGMSEAKQEVMEFVKFLQNPGKYEKLGAKIPRGAILSGPPGTGKTLIARATAGEAGVPFYSVSGSEFVEMFVGVGASRVRDLFKTARENAPSIVFVDEIDAIGKNRSKGNASGANDERESTLNQLLVEMDGFDSSSHVVVLAGTNRPDILDKALMRPGRFDRHIAIDNPELQGRIEIFNVHLQKIKVVDNIDKDLAGRLAALTPGFSGADIANVCNEAALIAARYNAKSVTLRHFELAIERVIGGVEKKSKLLDPQEKRVVAYHEAGHAVCGWFLRYAHPLLKVSIIPRGQGALGYAQYLPPDQHLMSTLQLYDRMIMTLGGRVSEELNFASVTSGAHDDFKKVTQIAQSMVLRFGMSDKVGMVNYADTQSQDNLTKPFSDETNDVIDQEIRRIVQECYNTCKQLLTEKKDAVELVAQELLKKEFITREDMIRLLGKRPFPETNDAFDKYLDGKPAYQNEQPADEKKDDEK